MKKANAVSMQSLSKPSVEWITETAISLLENRTPSEVRAKEELAEIFPEVEEQVYFRIGGHSYFLDFFIPEDNIAIEIDGGYHLGRKQQDIRRDEAFGEIGIKTVRIRAERVMDGFLKEDLFKGLKRPLKKKKQAKKQAKNRKAKTKKQKARERFEKFKKIANGNRVPERDNSSHIILV